MHHQQVWSFPDIRYATPCYHPSSTCAWFIVTIHTLSALSFSSVTCIWHHTSSFFPTLSGIYIAPSLYLTGTTLLLLLNKLPLPATLSPQLTSIATNHSLHLPCVITHFHTLQLLQMALFICKYPVHSLFNITFIAFSQTRAPSHPTRVSFCSFIRCILHTPLCTNSLHARSCHHITPSSSAITSPTTPMLPSICLLHSGYTHL